VSKLSDGGGLSVSVEAGRLLDHMPDPHWRRGVDITVSVTNISTHTLPPVWNILLACATGG
jgi:hypothetical protein